MGYEQALLLALQGLKIVAQLVAQLRGQSGMTDDELLDKAEVNDKAVRDQIKTFLATLPPPETP